MEAYKSIPPTIMVIFGVSGDLAKRFLLPALAEIKRAGVLPDNFKIIGLSRQDISRRRILKTGAANLTNHIELLKFDPSTGQDYRNLKRRIGVHKRAFGSQSQVIFHLSLPPDIVPLTVKRLAEAKLNGPASKLLLEKPFGRDYISARRLINQISRCFNEDQIYRVDHYLAKEMAQNILVFLRGNSLLREIWHRQFIESIEIVASEKIGIEGRANFYEQTGALRDIIQSHLLQLACLVLMDLGGGLPDLPAKRLAVLRRLSAVPGSAVRGQYRGYRREAGARGSITETFAALQLSSTDKRWRGVPVYLAAGKSLNQKLTEIRVRFRREEESLQANLLVLRVQPREGIELDLWVKEPGYENRVKKLPLSFNYQQHYQRLPDAYEKVLVDAMRSDQTLFASSQEVLASWKILGPVQKSWASTAKGLIFYKPGAAAGDILGRSS